MIWEFSELVGRRLLLWAAVSVLVGAVLATGADPWWQGFGVQALAWGAIDGAIGLAGVRGARRGRQRAIGDTEAQRRESRRLRRLLLLNAGLDLLYVAGGLVLAGPIAAGDPFLAGMGWGVVAQGLFLLVFDLLHALWVPDGSPVIPEGIDLFAGEEHAAFRVRPSAPGDGPGPAALLVHGFGGTPAELRDLAARLAATGWTVEVPLLPGFGAGIRELPDRRAPDWLGAVLGAGTRLREEGHGPLLLGGFSLGAALALSAERSLGPDGLVLVAPFWWPERRIVRLAAPLIRPFLPAGLRPFGRLDLAQPDVREGIAGSMSGLDLDDPAVVAGIRELRVPVSLLEQLFVVSRWASAAAAEVQAPVLGVIGTTDSVATPERARRLLGRLPRPARVLEVAAGHDLLTRASPVREEVEDAVVAFGSELLAAPAAPASVRAATAARADAVVASGSELEGGP